MCNDYAISPIQTWRTLDRAQRITLLAVTIALLAFGVGFYVWIASVA